MATTPELASYLPISPTFAVKDGMVVITVDDTVLRFIMPLSAFRATVRKATVLLAEFDQLPDPVIPLCELCVRHNLPKH